MVEVVMPTLFEGDGWGWIGPGGGGNAFVSLEERFVETSMGKSRATNANVFQQTQVLHLLRVDARNGTYEFGNSNHIL